MPYIRVALGLIVATLSGCAYLTNEGYRTQLAYDTSTRGHEKYTLRKDSLDAAKETNQNLNDAFTAHMKTVLCASNYPKSFDTCMSGGISTRPDKTGATGTGSSLQQFDRSNAPILPFNGPSTINPPGQGKEEIASPPQVPSRTLEKAPLTEKRAPVIDPIYRVQQAPMVRKKDPVAEVAPRTGPMETLETPLDTGIYYYNLDAFWPMKSLNQLIEKTDKENTIMLAREMNNLLWMRSLRDLITEPSMYSMQPTEREVTLRCAPPPEQSVIQTAMSIAASAKHPSGVEGGLDFRLAESVMKLFEQTERTVFLQYAMFRLCEMGINSPSEFRNAFPLVMQEVIRQSAGLTLEAAVEADRAKKAIAESDAAKAKAQVQLKCLQDIKENTGQTGDRIAAVCGALSKSQPPDEVPEAGKPPAESQKPEAEKQPAEPQKPETH